MEPDIELQRQWANFLSKIEEAEGVALKAAES